MSPEVGRPRSRGAICVRVLPVGRRSKSEGGAGRRGPSWTHGPRHLATPRHLQSDLRKSAMSPASRARCLKPYAARPPVAVTFQASFPFRRGSLTTAVGTIDGAWRPVTAVRRCHRGSPVMRERAHRDRAASAVAARVCVLHPVATTAPDPHSKTPLEAPLVDRGARIIRAVFFRVRNFFFGEAKAGPLACRAIAQRIAPAAGG